jgi:N-acetylmuramoyl-L-alanine amidase
MKKKNRKPILFILFCVAISIFAFSGEQDHSSTKAKFTTIIIDAGHGFKGSLSARDGAGGANVSEDEISYAVSKKLVAELQKELPGVKVLESRPTPYFVSLRERSNFANNNKGNLFVSIHCNFAIGAKQVRQEGTKTEVFYDKTGKGKKAKSVKKTRVVPIYKTYQMSSKAEGTETYVFAVNKLDDKEEIVMENGDIFQSEKDDSSFNVNINDPIVKQQVALWTKQFFANSVKLASLVEDEFVAVGRKSRGVKQRQKGIWVLQATAMPSILVEIGFLSNEEEEAYLMSEDGQQETAQCITRAIKRYKDLLDKGQSQQAVAPSSGK